MKTKLFLCLSVLLCSSVNAMAAQEPCTQADVMKSVEARYGSRYRFIPGKIAYNQNKDFDEYQFYVVDDRGNDPLVIVTADKNSCTDVRAIVIF